MNNTGATTRTDAKAEELAALYALPDHAILTDADVLRWLRLDTRDRAGRTTIVYYRNKGMLRGVTIGGTAYYYVHEVKAMVEQLWRDQHQGLAPRRI